MKATTADLLQKVKAEAPLIHNITNYVVMNTSANILLAAGASPVMAHCRAEVEEMTGLAGALVLNIGTLQEDWVTTMIIAAKAANSRGIPVILDPVGAGATALRTAAVHTIMSQADISVLRGNASEIFSLVDAQTTTKGVDACMGLNAAVIEAAKTLALEQACIIAISGNEDCITDGRQVYRVANGHPLMTRVTGMGCGLTALTGAFCAVAQGRLLKATAAAFGFYGICGELAARISNRPGSFFVAFLDALHATGHQEICQHLKLTQA